MKRSLRLLALAGALLGAVAPISMVGCRGGQNAAGPKSLLESGEPAPPLVATASDGRVVDLAQLRGKHVVVYFYPKDDTPGCTKEACAFRDAWGKLEAAGVQVIGVSSDDDASHRAFAEKHKLPFPLLADTDLRIARSFGVSSTAGYVSRVTFLIGPDGKISKVYPSVDPALHADQILTDVGAKT